MFHHRFSHLFHFRPLHYGATEKLGANQFFSMLAIGMLAIGVDPWYNNANSNLKRR